MESLSLFLTLKTVHIVSFAVWFGLPLALSAEIKKSLTDRGTSFNPDRIDAVHKVLMIFGLATFVTGFLLIFAKGGFAMVHPNIHIGLVLTIILLGIEHGMTFRIWKSVKSAFSAGNLPEAQLAAKKYGTFSSVEHFLKLVIIFLMVFRY
ncbi:MAG: hypothetical protein LCH54_11345 [Bacteroidetes bacterium]|nr:hypothetical protein [Bacteroidota bacterium]